MTSNEFEGTFVMVEVSMRHSVITYHFLIYYTNDSTHGGSPRMMSETPGQQHSPHLPIYKTSKRMDDSLKNDI